MQNLRSEADWGIHGVKRKNLQSILQGREFISEKDRDIIWGHYFFVGDKQKQLPETEFYQRLWSSIYKSLGYSTSYEIVRDKAVFEDTPCILLGISNKNGRYSRRLSGGDSDGFWGCLYGNSFPIRHDFVHTNIYPIKITDEEIETANKNMKLKCLRALPQIQACFMNREIISRVIGKIANRLKVHN